MESDSYQEKNTKDKKKENSKVYDSIISKREEEEKKVEFKIEKSNKGYYNIEVFPKLLKLEAPIYKQDVPLWAVMLKRDRNLFKDYLLTESEIDQLKVKKFFGKGNKDNIRPQSPESNRVYQLHFEQEVDNYLKGMKKSGSSKEVNERKVYYEIEVISDISSNILGRRIYIHWFDDDKNNIHVFIPEESMNISD